MNNISYLTQEGYDKIKGEIDYLKTTARQEAAKAIAEAREKGDLSENAEYHAAKDAQGMLEMKINELEKKIRLKTQKSSSIRTYRCWIIGKGTWRKCKNYYSCW